MKRPPPLPGVLPFRVDAAGAAYLVGERSADAFKAGVAAGHYPPGRKIGARLLWLTRDLARAVDPDGASPQDAAHPASLDALIDRNLADDRSQDSGRQTR